MTQCFALLELIAVDSLVGLLRSHHVSVLSSTYIWHIVRVAALTLVSRANDNLTACIPWVVVVMGLSVTYLQRYKYCDVFINQGIDDTAQAQSAIFLECGLLE